MARTKYCATEDRRMHLFLLNALHTASREHPKTISVVAHHKVSSQRGIYQLRDYETIISVYHISSTTLLHASHKDQKRDYISFTGKSRDIDRAYNKVKNITNIHLSSLEVRLQH